MLSGEASQYEHCAGVTNRVVAPIALHSVRAAVFRVRRRCEHRAVAADRDAAPEMIVLLRIGGLQVGMLRPLVAGGAQENISCESTISMWPCGVSQACTRWPR